MFTAGEIVDLAEWIILTSFSFLFPYFRLSTHSNYFSCYTEECCYKPASQILHLLVALLLGTSMSL